MLDPRFAVVMGARPAEPDEEELPQPTERGVLRPDQAAVGPNILPIVRLRVMSAEEWEAFVLEWASSLRTKYARVTRASGAGDKGRDIVARASQTDLDPWDNYQCKHYGAPLAPSQIWVELGKLCWFTFSREFSLPRAYYFVSPYGVGPSLSNLLDNPVELKLQLLANWNTYCRAGIRNDPTELSDELRAHIEAIDFSIFQSVSPLAIIEQHRETPYYAARFGGGLPDRPRAPEPPQDVEPAEAVYVRALLDAYEDRFGGPFESHVDLADEAAITHLTRSRREFYSAESLREFSRDTVPDGTFSDLLDEVYQGVVDVIEMEHPDGLERVLRVVAQAKALNLTSNALIAVTRPIDRGGMCHQLANQRRVVWRA